MLSTQLPVAQVISTPQYSQYAKFSFGTDCGYVPDAQQSKYFGRFTSSRRNDPMIE
jgi:hypothetical protein